MPFRIRREVGWMTGIRKGLVVGVVAVLAQGAAAELTNGLYAAFDTTMGGFTCRLDYAEAPLTCANFVGLAEGTQNWVSTNGAVKAEPFYDGLIFHRVITNFMVQGGCPLGTGTSGPGYAFPDEFSTNLTHHSAGILSMANSGPDSNGSQFFVTLTNTSWLNGKHAVFGEVVDGMNTVSNIGVVVTDGGNRPKTDVVMNAVQILRVGVDAEAFDPADQPLPEVSGLPLDLSVSNNAPSLLVGLNEAGYEQQIFISQDLKSWWLGISRYTSSLDFDWTISFPDSMTNVFCRAVSIYYPQAIHGLAHDIEGNTFDFYQDTKQMSFSFDEQPNGSFVINGISGVLSNWQWGWDKYWAELAVLLSTGEVYRFHRGEESELWSCTLSEGALQTDLGEWSTQYETIPW